MRAGANRARSCQHNGFLPRQDCPPPENPWLPETPPGGPWLDHRLLYWRRELTPPAQPGAPGLPRHVSRSGLPTSKKFPFVQRAPLGVARPEDLTKLSIPESHHLNLPRRHRFGLEGHVPAHGPALCLQRTSATPLPYPLLLCGTKRQLQQPEFRCRPA